VQFYAIDNKYLVMIILAVVF